MVSPKYPPPLCSTKRSDIYDAISPYGALRNSAAGRSILITGAGRGVGRAQAITFSQAGAKRVTIVSRSEDQLNDVAEAVKKVVGNSTEVILCKTDVTNQEDVERAFDAAGKVDVLINNAGSMETQVRIHESDPDNWWKSYEVNVKGTYLPTREALKRASANANGQPIPLTIINVSSMGSLTSFPDMSGYQSSKMALNRFTELIHLEYFEKGVRVFAFHPGGILTELAKVSHPYMHQWLTDTPELPAGYALWLATQGDKVDFLRGRFSSAIWDVDELLGKKEEIEKNDLLWTRLVGQDLVLQP